jgi:hypothetical protein
MMDLMKHHLVRPVAPEHYLRRAGSFEEAFLKVVDEAPLRDLQDSFAAGERFVLRVEKLTVSLAEELEDIGLAKRHHLSYYDVERSVGHAYMAFLASYLGAQPNLNMQPITHRREALDDYRFPLPQHPVREIRDALLVETFEGLLPAPSVESVDARDLESFKTRHHEQLARFRRHLELQVNAIAAIANEDLRQEQKALVLGELAADRDEILARMHEHGWTHVNPGTLCGLVAAGLGVAAAAAEGTTLPITAAGSALVAALWGVLGEQRRERVDARSAPLAYAAIASRSFGR